MFNTNFKLVPIFEKGTTVTSRSWGRGIVLDRTKLLPDWMTLVRFRSDPTGDQRMAVFTEFLVR